MRLNDKNFILDGWDPYKYSHIICDEINLDNFDQEIYKLITEGAQISANRKNEKASVVSCRVPMIFIANKKPKQYPGLYERLKFVKADTFVKILNINEYLRFDWSIPENQLRCQPNPELMPVFKCLNTTPPNLITNLYEDSVLEMTPNSIAHSLNHTNLSNKSKENSSNSSSNSSCEENLENTDDLIKKPKKAKSAKRLLESDNDDESSKNQDQIGINNYTLNDIINGKKTKI